MSVTSRKRDLSNYESEGLEGLGDGNAKEEEEEEVFVSAPILDRSSTFVAHFHPLRVGSGTRSKPKSLTSDIKSQQNHPAFSSADHRMVAWRRPSTQRTLLGATGTGTATARNVICTTGSDDDGEKYAGKRLERVLIDLNVEGTVVVARWYGGIMLGPVRFTHIENAAKDAIRQWKSKQQPLPGMYPDGGRVGTGDANGGASASGTKRLKVGPDVDDGKGRGKDVTSTVDSATKDEAERSRLARQLVERDNSIIVLRGLLAEKTAAAATATAAAAAGDINTTPANSQSTLAAESPTRQPASASKDGGPAESLPSQGNDPAAVDPLSTATSSLAGPSSQPTAKKMDYDEMPLQRLRMLDKARDATIAFILKQLDKADENDKAGGTEKQGT